MAILSELVVIFQFQGKVLTPIESENDSPLATDPGRIFLEH